VHFINNLFPGVNLFLIPDSRCPYETSTYSKRDKSTFSDNKGARNGSSLAVVFLYKRIRNTVNA
jgi:site-specific recombinase